MTEGSFPKIAGEALYSSEVNYQAGNFIQALAGENIAAGQWVYIKESGGRAWIAAIATGFVNGVCVSTVTTGQTALIQTSGRYTTSGLTANTPYFLGVAGALTATSNYLKVGVAISTTDLEINIVRENTGGSPITIILHPVLHDITIVQGTWAWQNNAQYYCSNLFNNSTTHAQNDEFVLQVFLMKGTWEFQVNGLTSTNHAIITVSIDGTTAGTFDMYAGGGTYNSTVTISNVVVATTGLKTMSFKAATKNNSSNDYYLYLSVLTFTRTA